MHSIAQECGLLLQMQRDLHVWASFAETDEPIEVLFGVWDRMAQEITR